MIYLICQCFFYQCQCFILYVNASYVIAGNFVLSVHDFKTLPYFLWCLIANMVNILIKIKSSKRGEETGRRKTSFAASYSWLAEGKCSPLLIDTDDSTYSRLLDLQGSLCIWIMD